jgi:glycogen operon protein
VNFSVFSKNATLMELLLFDNADSILPVRVIRLDPRNHRTYHYWHAFVPGLKPGQVYGFKATGPFEPERGLRFDRNRVLLVPCGRSIAFTKKYRHDNPAIAMKSVIADPSSYTGRVISHLDDHSWRQSSTSCMSAVLQGILVRE